MFITRLKLHNWRNFVDVDVPLQQRTFIVGPNASGKSNLLDAILFLRDVVRDDGGLAVALECRGGFDNVRSHHAPNERMTTIELELDDDPWPEHSEWRYTLRIAEDPSARSGAGLACEELRRHGEVCFRSQGGRRSVGDSCMVPIIDALSSVRHLDRSDRRTIVRHMADAGTAKRERTLARICEALRPLVPQITSLQIARDDATPDLKLIATHEVWHEGQPYDPQFSDGTWSLIAILWSLLTADGPMLIEHPENSLQSAIQHHLTWAFARPNDPPRRQVIATTHSCDLVLDEGVAPEEVLTITPTSGGSMVACGVEDASAVAIAQAGGSAGEILLSSANGRVGLDFKLRLE